MRIRRLKHEDLPIRVEWVNNPKIHKSMHFEVPITIEGTEKWFRKVFDNHDRADFAFEIEGKLCAMGGFTSMSSEAELYVFVDPNNKGNGIGSKATSLLCEYGFMHLHLNKIFLYTNGDNLPAQRTYQKLGFKLLTVEHDAAHNGDGKIVDRFKYSLFLEDFHSINEAFFLLDEIIINDMSVKVVRDDIFPSIGGGSKARKAVEYEQYFLDNGINAMVTTGGIQSNHNRAIALMATRNGWNCHLVYHGSADRFYEEKGNALLVRSTTATTEFVEADKISQAMDMAMERFKAEGLTPYYIHGGGHDLPGGIAYVKAVLTLYKHCKKHRYKPKYIFLPSGTGSTHAGIVVGLYLVGWEDVRVIGISVARKEERGKKIVAEFANMLADYYNIKKDFTQNIFFDDRFISGGYERANCEEIDFITKAIKSTGLIFDTTYSGKALWGMKHYIDNKIVSDNVLFWHTGGIMNFLK